MPGRSTVTATGVPSGSSAKCTWATEARIANGRFHGGLELIESAEVDSGEVVVQIVRGRSLIGLGWSYIASAAKLKSRREPLREYRGKRIHFDTRPRMPVSIDGELGPDTPFEVGIAPAAVLVAAPREP